MLDVTEAARRACAGREREQGRRRVLILVSSYAPTMIADMHRARHLAWTLPDANWEPVILAPDASYQDVNCLDADSREFFAAASEVHFVGPFAARLFALFKSKSIGIRALIPLWRAGRRLLKSGRFEAVFLSTTQFPLFLLGPLWRREFGTPYVLDIHDPIYREGRQHELRLHRGLKHVLARTVMRHVERVSVLSASGIVSVSPVYLQTLRQRYAAEQPDWDLSERTLVSPFAVLPRDIEIAAPDTASAEGRKLRVVYNGAGGPIMQRGFALICRALRLLRERGDPLVGNALSFELHGTARLWREGEPLHLTQAAKACGVGDIVHENPRWLSYRSSMATMCGGDGILVLGVDDAGYMPSKLFSALALGKPLLAVLRQDGPAYAAVTADPTLGYALWFTEGEEMPVEAAAEVVRRFLSEVSARATIDRTAALAPYGASAMAERHARLFAAVSGVGACRAEARTP